MEVIPTILTVLAVAAAIYIIVLIVQYIFYGYTAALTGLEKGSDSEEIPADKMASGANTGNYTYSIWAYVQDWNYRFGDEKDLFVRQGDDSNEVALRVYLGENSNNIIVETRCYPPDGATARKDSEMFKCTVDNFPLQSWVNLTISQYGRTLDMYIDGKLVRTCVAPSPAKPGTGAVIITGDGGFHGYTSKFRYFDEPSNPQQAYNIYKDGPSSEGGAGGYKLKISVWKADEKKWNVTI